MHLIPLFCFSILLHKPIQPRVPTGKEEFKGSQPHPSCTERGTSREGFVSRKEGTMKESRSFNLLMKHRCSTNPFYFCPTRQI